MCFSCYIWNINIILDIISSIKKIFPNIIIILGGPEVSYEYEYLFKKNVDIISIGEGEQTFKEILEYFIFNKSSLFDIKSIAFKHGGNIIKTELRAPISLNTIPFVYYDCINEFENKIIYYEASRGCPYNCQYCLSSSEKGVRFLSLDRVFSDLKFFLDKKVKQVKFVDRTFNCNKNFAVSIWKFLIDNDNGISNFHFEISADILDDDMIEIVSKARKRLFQFEIGVQSTNYTTLNFIKRKTDIKKLFCKVNQIKKARNIHQHLDLIAGLPYEDYISFANSFNDVFLLYPEQFQLGFLKLLKGSGLRRDAEKYGIVYKDKPPYEVLYTKHISYEQMQRLKRIEEMVETYYNSGKCIYIIKYIIPFFSSPFNFFERLSIYWEKMNYHEVSHNKMKLYTIFYEFCKENIKDTNIIKNIIKFDMFLNDNVKNFPYWLEENTNDKLKQRIKNFYNNYENIEKYVPMLKNYTSKQISRMCHIEKFDFDIFDWIDDNFKEIRKRETYILFNYYGRDDLYGNVEFYKI